MERRNTIQKELVLQAVNLLKNHATADEVYDYIHMNHPNVGKGTVYRNLGILAQEGKILKIEISDGPDRYDHNTVSHYHVKCIKCGRVEDVDMDYIENIEQYIHNQQGFQFVGYDILFKGICPLCQSKNN